MLKRLLAAIILTLLPIGAMADDAAPAADPTPAPAETAAPAPAAAPSAGLGPDSISPSAGGSNADSAALQPAGVSPIQSGTTDSTGISAPSGALQMPADSSSALRVLAGEADGTPHQLDDSSATPWLWLGFGLLLAIIAAALVVFRDRRRFSRVEI